MAVILLVILGCLAVPNLHRQQTEAAGPSAPAPEREGSRVSFALEIAHSPDAGTIVRISGGVAFSLAGSWR
jgi:hypothetical protein